MDRISNAGWWVVGLAAVAACGGNAATHQAPPVAPVVVRSDPASAAQCAHGGSVVSSGLDDNDNGALDDAEIQSATVVCNDPPVEPPPKIVVRLVVEPIGEHCALAGTAVQSGPDRDGDGRLDDDEVAHADYLCGEVLLTRLAAEPPGARCVAGGVALQIGRDRDRDGVLGDAEVEQTELSCGDELSRDVVIASAADAAALAGIVVIDGNLAIRDSDLTELVLPRLVQVRGALEVTDDALLAQVSLPALQSVDGRLELARDVQLATVALPQLRRVGSLILDGVRLRDLSGFSALTTVAHDLQISGDDELVSTDLMRLDQLGGDLTIEHNDRLSQISWRLPGRGTVRIRSNPQLETVELPIGFSSDGLGGLTIASNARLGRVSLSVGRIDAIRVEDNPRLADLVINTSQLRGDVVVRNNGPLRLVLAGSTLFEQRVSGSVSLVGPIEALDITPPLVVHGDCTITATRLTSGPALDRVDGALALDDNDRFTELRLGGLVHAGSLAIAHSAALTAIDLPALAEVTSIEIRGNAALGRLELPSLQSADLGVFDNPRLPACAVEALFARVPGDHHQSGNDDVSECGP